MHTCSKKWHLKLNCIAHSYQADIHLKSKCIHVYILQCFRIFLILDNLNASNEDHYNCLPCIKESAWFLAYQDKQVWVFTKLNLSGETDAQSLTMPSVKCYSCWMNNYFGTDQTIAFACSTQYRPGGGLKAGSLRTQSFGGPMFCLFLVYHQSTQLGISRGNPVADENEKRG